MINRREALAALAMTGVVAGARAQQAVAPENAVSPAGNFALSGTYLNAAYTHPLPLDAAAAMRDYIDTRTDSFARRDHRRDANALFARLINAKPEEIAGVPSTSFGEMFVASSLGLFENPRLKIVSDILHFDGSLYMYTELSKAGNPLVILPMEQDGRIDMNRLEAAVDTKTRLVAISAVSMINGFEHDLRTVCDIAHRKGAYVYVDAIQAAGAVPIDVRATGVDFLACATFKWLQGDFGYGFLYAREDLLPKIKRRAFGYHQFDEAVYHALPGDKPGGRLFEATPDNVTAAGHFEVGSMGTAAQVAAAVSLENLLGIGVANIGRARQPLMDRLYSALSQHYEPLTPQDSKSSIISFTLIDAKRKLKDKLREARINIELYDHRFRISPSIYNSMDDIEKVIGVLT